MYLTQTPLEHRTRDWKLIFFLVFILRVYACMCLLFPDLRHAVSNLEIVWLKINWELKILILNDSRLHYGLPMCWAALRINSLSSPWYRTWIFDYTSRGNTLKRKPPRNVLLITSACWKACLPEAAGSCGTSGCVYHENVKLARDPSAT